jgi:superfamily II DNA helicase RecQ
VNSISRFRWGPQLRPNQEYALSFIFDNTAANGKVLLVDRTGGGKSHVMRCAGVIMLIVVPLLSLAADIIQKFDNDDDSHGIIDAIHFDEDIGSDNNRRAQLIADMCAIKRSTRWTLFLFISPQRLHKYIDLRRALLHLSPGCLQLTSFYCTGLSTFWKSFTTQDFFARIRWKGWISEG